MRMNSHSCKENQEALIQAIGCMTGSGDSSPASKSSSSSHMSSFRSSWFQMGGRYSSGFGRVFDAESPCPTTNTTSPLTTVVKRKRPGRIEIPDIGVSPVGFGGEEEKRGGGIDVVEIGSTRFSVYCKRGKVKNHMEDRFCASVNIADDSKLAFFGVFDGHGGTKAAEFVAKNIEKNVMDEVPAGVIVGEAGSSNSVGRINEAVKTGYLRTDSQLLSEDVTGGSCSVTSLIKNGHLIVSNAGDCRAVISKAGIAEALTSDHRPSREDEKARIEFNGGYVDKLHGVWRLQGSLAVSRGMGDSNMKHWVIPDPETTVLRIKPEHELLILASDGLWDKVSNQEAVDIARPAAACTTEPNNTTASLLSAACKKLADLSVSRGSSDDVTAMVINLAHFA